MMSAQLIIMLAVFTVFGLGAFFLARDHNRPVMAEAGFTMAAVSVTAMAGYIVKLTL